MRRVKHFPATETRVREVLRMSQATKPSPQGSDWTRLLTDPDLVSHLGKLLQTYREVAPAEREPALLRAMREIKDAAVKAREARSDVAVAAVPAPRAVLHHPEPIDETPPFEPDLFTPQMGSDRRRFHRIKCYVAVEIHVEGIEEPVWGNLANVSRGGCLVETAGAVPAGKALEIGLWVTSGKIWVKGVIISGVATRSAPTFGVRVKFSEAELSEKEHLREFLKFVESTSRKSQYGKAYVAQLKR
jgi:PilZ domain-containing protein